MNASRPTLVLLALVLTSQMWGANVPAHTSRIDLFDSFRLLDAHFTKLDSEFHNLQDSVDNDKSVVRTKRAWQHSVRNMQSETARISRVSYQMYKHYRRGQVPRRMFLRLRRRAKLLNAHLSKLARSRSRQYARRETRNVQKAMLNLVLQYQALSGGYAAAHCGPGAWVCGVPKEEPRKIGYPHVGVKWTCVERSRSCKGILGPRTPQLAPQPLTANKLPH
jgi:hypothetical protein